MLGTRSADYIRANGHGRRHRTRSRNPREWLAALAKAIGRAYDNVRDLCLIASFSRWTVPFRAGPSMNSATKARPMSSCSIVPKRPRSRRPSQATYPGV
jgi:hypothetical protein